MNKNYFKLLQKHNQLKRKFQEGGQVPQDPNMQQGPNAQQMAPQDPNMMQQEAPQQQMAPPPPQEGQQAGGVTPEMMQMLQQKALEYSKNIADEKIAKELGKLVLKLLNIPFAEPAKTIELKNLGTQDGAAEKALNTILDRPKSYFK